MKRLISGIIAGILVLSLVGCGGSSGGSCGGKAIDSAKLTADSKAFGESPAIENEDDRYKTETKVLELDGKTYRSGPLFFQKPMFGGGNQLIIPAGDKMLVKVENVGNESSKDAVFIFNREGNVLTEQGQMNHNDKISARYLEYGWADKNGIMYTTDNFEVFKTQENNFVMISDEDFSVAMMTTPNGDMALMEYDFSMTKFEVKEDGTIETDGGTQLPGFARLIPVKDGALDVENATAIENYVPEGYRTNGRIFRTPNHFYSILEKDNRNDTIKQMDFEGNQTFLFQMDVDVFNDIDNVIGIAELDNKIFVFGRSSILVLSEAGEFIDMLRYSDMDITPKKGSGIPLTTYIDTPESETYKHLSGWDLDRVVQDCNGRIYASTLMEKMDTLGQINDTEIVVYELLTYSGE